MTTFGNTALALGMIAAVILAIGGVKMAMRRADRQRGLLMIGAALVLFANVLIWTLPA